MAVGMDRYSSLPGVGDSGLRPPPSSAVNLRRYDRPRPRAMVGTTARRYRSQTHPSSPGQQLSFSFSATYYLVRCRNRETFDRRLSQCSYVDFAVAKQGSASSRPKLARPIDRQMASEGGWRHGNLDGEFNGVLRSRGGCGHPTPANRTAKGSRIRSRARGWRR